MKRWRKCENCHIYTIITKIPIDLGIFVVYIIMHNLSKHTANQKIILSAIEFTLL